MLLCIYSEFLFLLLLLWDNLNSNFSLHNCSSVYMCMTIIVCVNVIGYSCTVYRTTNTLVLKHQITLFAAKPGLRLQYLSVTKCMRDLLRCLHLQHRKCLYCRLRECQVSWNSGKIWLDPQGEEISIVSLVNQDRCPKRMPNTTWSQRAAMTNPGMLLSMTDALILVDTFSVLFTVLCEYSLTCTSFNDAGVMLCSL